MPSGGARVCQARRIVSPYCILAARGTIVLLPIVLTACQPAVLDPQGIIGIAEKTILTDSLAIMLAIVIPTIAATFAFAWWFRASNTRARYLPDFAYSGRLELIVWAIPLLVIMLLGGVTWIGSHDLDPAKPLASNTPPLEVQVVSLDWKWLFIYPEQHVASVNQLVVPAGVPVHFSLTSASVMNAFFIPQLGSMIYTMNGMTTQLNLQADAPGTFRGPTRWTCLAPLARPIGPMISRPLHNVAMDIGSMPAPRRRRHGVWQEIDKTELKRHREIVLTIRSRS